MQMSKINREKGYTLTVPTFHPLHALRAYKVWLYQKSVPLMLFFGTIFQDTNWHFLNSTIITTTFGKTKSTVSRRDIQLLGM